MKWPFDFRETLRLVFLSYLLYDVIDEWDAYSSCYAPIQLFLAMTYGSFIVLSLFFKLLDNESLPNWFIKILKFLFHWIVVPFMIYLPIQGFIWQIENMIKTDNCVPYYRYSGFTWALLVIMLIIGILMAVLTFVKIRNCIRMRAFRRRMGHFQELMERGDYETLNQLLLASEGDLNSTTGLLPIEIDLLQIQEYSQSLTQMLSFSHLKECPICFEDFKNGDQIMVLPKCKHAFHPECIRGWLVKNPLCPMCRGNVRANLYQIQDQADPQDAYQPVNRNNVQNIGQDLENPV